MNEDHYALAQLYKELEDNVTFTKALDFSVRIVNLYKYLRDEKKRNCHEQASLKEWYFNWS